MKECGLLFLLFSVFHFSCKQKADNNKTGEVGKNDTTYFFQVGHYLKSQIAEVNKTPYFIYKVDVVNGKKDSTPINTPVFDRISGRFLQPDLNDEYLKKNFSESIFHDQTTQSFTISYIAKDKELEVQNIDILLKEDGQTVKRLFIRKFFSYTDSSAIEQLSWKPGESLQVNRLVQKPGDKEDTYETTVVWNQKI